MTHFSCLSLTQTQKAHNISSRRTNAILAKYAGNQMI